MVLSIIFYFCFCLRAEWLWLSAQSESISLGACRQKKGVIVRRKMFNLLCRSCLDALNIIIFFTFFIFFPCKNLGTKKSVL